LFRHILAIVTSETPLPIYLLLSIQSSDPLKEQPFYDASMERLEMKLPGRRLQ